MGLYILLAIIGLIVGAFAGYVYAKNKHEKLHAEELPAENSAQGILKNAKKKRKL